MKILQETKPFDRLIASKIFKPIALLVCGYMLFFQLVTLTFVIVALKGDADFKQLYAAAYMVRTGHAHQMYNYQETARVERELVGQDVTVLPFNHLAYEALLVAPLSFFSYKTAFLIFFGVNVVLAYLCFVILKPLFAHLGELWKPLIYAPFLIFWPVVVTLREGQDSLLLLLAIILSFRFYDDKREFAAGVALALGLFKFNFVLPVTALFLLWKHWRFVKGFALGAATVGLTSLAVVGFGSWKTYGMYLLGMSTKLDDAGRKAYGVFPELMSNLRGFVSGAIGSSASQMAIQAIVVAASLLLILWASRKKESFALAACVAYLVSYHAFPHDQIILILPVAIVAAIAPQASGRLLVSGALIIAMDTITAMAKIIPVWLLAIPVLYFAYEIGKVRFERPLMLLSSGPWDSSRKFTARGSGGFSYCD